MSGIYIPGMEMPEKESLIITITTDGKCYANIWDAALGVNLLGNATSVPDHGRLGDLDALKEKAVMRSEKCGCLVNVTDFVISAYDIENAPTIIPADKEV